MPELPPRWAYSDRFVPKTFVQPVLTFMRNEASGGMLMLGTALLAILWANAPFGATYGTFWNAHIEIVFGSFELHHLSDLTLREWVNDGLMVLFFFVVGLEIKRELVVGELNDRRAAALPVIAALGGMILPAAIFLAFNLGGENAGAWGIPMATDIAFAVGVVALVGSRVPIGAKLFLLALAIVDDLGAILVIAAVYTEEIELGWLAAAAVGFGVVHLMNRANIRFVASYAVVGTLVWLAVLESGIHATVAGVGLALMTPVTSYLHAGRFVPRARKLVDRAAEYMPEDPDVEELDHRTSERVDTILKDMQLLTRETLPPLDRLEHALTPWSSYVVVPVFALANAGVRIPFSDLGSVFTTPIALGVLVGLVVGKTVGVTVFAWLAVRLGIGRLPPHTTWHHMIGMGLLAGIGFTVALFVSTLAGLTEASQDAAKIGIFAASLIAGVSGFVWLRFLGPDADDARDRVGVAAAAGGDEVAAVT